MGNQGKGDPKKNFIFLLNFKLLWQDLMEIVQKINEKKLMGIGGH